MLNTNHQEASNLQPDLLVAQELRKSYGPRRALQGLTFTLKAGRILGFLGPNGAGKTTSIRILTTMLQPESGHFTVNGVSSKEPERIRRMIGVLPENLGFPRQMTGIEYLTFFGRLNGRRPANAREYAMTLLEEVGLQKRARSLIGTYSHGMRQRIGIARALVNDPMVVFLDEPTLGLDPRGQQELLELIQKVAHERNTGVVLCSHLLSEIEGICDDVVILNLGQIVAKGSVAEVVSGVQNNLMLRNALRVQVAQASLENATEVLNAMSFIKTVTPAGEMDGLLRIELEAPPNGKESKLEEGITNKILSALINANVPILGFEIEGGRLQDVFLHLTEEVVK
jgi:ABC-2 type transport system ATP-binding protein